MIQINQDRLQKIEAIQLGRGAHESFEDGVCALELVSWLADEPFSDHQKCVSPVIAAFGRRWNDDLDDAGRQRLKPYLARFIGTKSTAASESKRAWMCTDWMIRQHAPAWLELAGLKEQADAVRALPEITKVSCEGAMPTVRSARDRAVAARAAAGAAARAKLEPTRVSLQASAFDLLDRMISLGGES